MAAADAAGRALQDLIFAAVRDAVGPLHQRLDDLARDLEHVKRCVDGGATSVARPVPAVAATSAEPPQKKLAGDHCSSESSGPRPAEPAAKPVVQPSKPDPPPASVSRPVSAGASRMEQLAARLPPKQEKNVDWVACFGIQDQSKDTPLLSVGNTVRVLKQDIARRAMISFIDEDDGTADVIFQSAGPDEGGTAPADEEDEETVKLQQIKALEDFESKAGLQKTMDENKDFFACCTVLKEQGNTLFKLKDYEAASWWYGQIVNQFMGRELCEEHWVMLMRDGALELARVRSVVSDGLVNLVFDKNGKQMGLSNVSVTALVPVFHDHLLLQTSVYMNRARCFANLNKNQEAAQDLTTVIGLWGCVNLLPDPEEGSKDAASEGLCKAHYLRGKTRLGRGRHDLAASDVKAAMAGNPAPALLRQIRQLERDIEISKVESSPVSAGSGTLWFTVVLGLVCWAISTFGLNAPYFGT